MKQLLLISLLFSVLFTFEDVSAQESNNQSRLLESVLNTKERAFTILEAKCNACHKEENKQRVFTMDNMDGYSKKIDRQVFKWERMPKGDEIKLTSTEYSDLKRWIEAVGQ
jgi:uncharacterized membrane protein